MIYYFAAELYI